MKIETLNQIISCKNIKKIDELIKQNGYLHASKNGKWKFNPIDIANANKVENSERYEDIFDDKVYVGDIHTQVKRYPNIEFIVITVNKVYRDRNNFEFPIQMELYVNTLTTKKAP